VVVPKRRKGKVGGGKIPFFFPSQNQRNSLKKIPLFPKMMINRGND
jgi:hypothetical protein